MSNPILIDEFQRITNGSISLTDSEKKELVIEYQETNNPDIAEKLLEAHYKLIIKVASTARKEFTKVDIRDLIQNGIIGFMKGLKSYKAHKCKSSKVTSYLFLWVREYINREIKFYYSEIKVPEWQLRLARAVDNEAAINKIDIVEAINRISEKSGTPVDKIYHVLLNKISLAPISKPIDPNSEQSFDNFLPDQTKYQPDELLSNSESMSNIDIVIKDILSDKEQFALAHNYGLWGREKLTLEEIGEYLGITKMAICHIIKKSLKKLKNAEGLKYG